ncbi:MAG: hypothetical protein ABIJ09_25290 [Pseudomonadota bacterium]
MFDVFAAAGYRQRSPFITCCAASLLLVGVGGCPEAQTTGSAADAATLDSQSDRWDSATAADAAALDSQSDLRDSATDAAVLDSQSDRRDSATAADAVALDSQSDRRDSASAADAAGDAADGADGGVGDSSALEDASEGDDRRTQFTCNPATTGLTAPLPECTVDNPCARPTGPDQTVPSAPPDCPLSDWDEVAEQQIVGTMRYACIHRAAASPRPLVLFFHPGGDGASVVSATSLLARSTTTNLTGVTGQTGFTLLAIHGRRIRFGTAANRDGEYHHDFYYRDLSSPSTNPDIANADAWIDRMISEGIVDTNRIYVMGWSNGAFFGQLYAVARHATGTPVHHARVAAAVVFAGGDPFNGIDANPFADPSFSPTTDGAECQLSTYPSSTVPILLVYRTCDVTVPCGPADIACWGTNRGYPVDSWLSKAATYLPNLTSVMINGAEPERSGLQDETATTCSDVAPRCGSETQPSAQQCLVDISVSSTAYCQCFFNHLRWPDNDYPGSTIDREAGMLLYLRANPLN